MNLNHDIIQEFPALTQKVNEHDLIYLDNAASTLKPKCVIQNLTNYYSFDTANIHRGAHFLSNKSTDLYEGTRKKVKDFINAKSYEEIIFTKGTTEAINLVANSFCKKFMNEGDEIILTQMEHHSNIIPWQLIAHERNLKIKVLPINEDGDLIYNDLNKLITRKTKIISCAFVSNTLGTINDIDKIISIAKENDIFTFIDAAQASAHIPIDVQKLDCDFLAFSAHKMYGPTGLGVLYGKKDILNQLPPYQGGGDMIETVDFDKSTFNVLPYKFEAGTPPIAEVVAFSSSIDFLEKIGFNKIHELETSLINYTLKGLESLDGIKLIGTPQNRCSVISFRYKNYHPYDIGHFLDIHGIAVRTGHHCTQPIMKFYDINSTVRISVSIYNTYENIDKLITILKRIDKFL